MVFHLLRNAGVMRPNASTRMAVCWGGHSISREEYAYTKTVGYELGLRSLNVCTGCGPGAMKGPMKGAALGHAKQRFRDGRFLGISEPGIIAAESPNPIVTELVIMPDIEKRLEAFVRVAHGIIVFPGGVGTLEEILYLLGLLLHPDNQQQPLPLIFTGPESARSYFEEVDAFIGTTLGAQAQARYQIIIDDPVQVAQLMTEGIAEVRSYRKQTEDAYYFNWRLNLMPEFQQPFVPNHDSMRALNLSRKQPVHQLAANLRRAFSGIVAGNVKDEGVTAVEAHGPFELNGDVDVIAPLDTLLASFVDQQRMKLAGAAYRPCYRIGGKG
jgi:predicted Rossmann-fold nucleotide-binding protein